MPIYNENADDFIKDVRENKIARILKGNSEGKPGQPEVNSWNNSLSKVRDLIELAGLKDCYVALEYTLPYNRTRIDCLLFGKGENGESNVVLLELKQWSAARATEDEGNFVMTYTGGRERLVSHPSQQVKGYHNNLKEFITAFGGNTPAIHLHSFVYCHNYIKAEDSGLFDPIYKKLFDEFLIYADEDTMALAEKLKTLLSAGEGKAVHYGFMGAEVVASKKLLENANNIIADEKLLALLNEQLVAKNTIWSKVRKAERTKTKSVIIVHGGPGTGKSAIAINVLAEMAARRKAGRVRYKVYYACKSKSFINGLRYLTGDKARPFFSNLYRFIPSKTKENELDLLLVDEAHRIENSSNHQMTKEADKTDMPQIDQLVRCAKTAVFFIDDRQNVRSQEIGHSELIREAARKYNCTISEITLETQFRCMGSNDYILWLEAALGYTDEKRELKKNEVFDFQILSSPQVIYDELQKKENKNPNSARLTAGFCWPWSKQLDENGALIKDVRIGDFAMPWETSDKIETPPAGYVQWWEWAYLPEGFKQVGCIYTSQGFEFDYIGVIIGDDLYYDTAAGKLKANINANRDYMLTIKPENFEMYVKNIYRTLLTRAMKGCFVYFVNKETESYFRSLME
ncbi:DUF2075 domain-containing protein [Chitinophaga sp. SYP-B3965]|uniref:DUF2075 domain-containing protein n=1 Tax=Chitinophaga sp. SYP-B3965 TaxID=2663120 RepID=UPI001299693D|nr:DUF2075 domain-containing protein [Chitinophaga sp. SYP-B3965]MRG45525.1 DUF2075 domain-containing protein [Chitinophaga sp. SYP-B3965]